MLPKRRLRLAVTGRNGQVARALQGLANSTVEVLTVARPELDLASEIDPTELLEGLGPDVIVNAAAYTAVDKAESEQELARAINARGAALVARAAGQLEIPIIHISTDYVFDGKSARPYREDDIPSPINVYGATKLEGEQAVKAATDDHVILRTSWVYAPDGQNFFLTMLRLAQQCKELRVVDDQRGAPTTAADIARTIVLLAGQLAERPADQSLRGTFHFTSAGETTWAGFAREIFRISEERGGPSALVLPITSAQHPTAARRPAYSRLDLSRISQIGGVDVQDWSEALQKTFEAL